MHGGMIGQARQGKIILPSHYRYCTEKVVSSEDNPSEGSLDSLLSSNTPTQLNNKNTINIETPISNILIDWTKKIGQKESTPDYREVELILSRLKQ